MTPMAPASLADVESALRTLAADRRTLDVICALASAAVALRAGDARAARLHAGDAGDRERGQEEETDDG